MRNWLIKCMFLMNLIRECIISGSAVRITCDMRKDATPETLCTVLPALLRRRRKQMQLRKNATPQWLISSSPTACHNTSLPVSLKSGYLKNICSMVNSVAVRRIGREATKTMASSAEGVCSHNQCNKGRVCQQKCQ